MRVCLLVSGSARPDLALALESAVVASEPPPGRWEVAIACDWRAVAHLWEIDARRRCSHLVTLEHRSLAPERPERLPALLTLMLPLDYLVTSRWLERAVADVRPGARTWRVPVARRPVAVEPPAPLADEPLRVFGADGNAPAGAVGVDSPRSADVMIDLGAPSDPFAAPVSPIAALLEAFAAGATAVAVPTEGRDELVVHGENGLLVAPADVPGALSEVAALAADRERLAALRAGALATAAAAPDPLTAGAQVLAVLERVLEADEPSGADPGETMRGALAEAAKLSAYESARADELREWARRLDARDAELRDSAGGGLIAALRRRASGHRVS